MKKSGNCSYLVLLIGTIVIPLLIYALSTFVSHVTKLNRTRSRIYRSPTHKYQFAFNTFSDTAIDWKPTKPATFESVTSSEVKLQLPASLLVHWDRHIHSYNCLLLRFSFIPIGYVIMKNTGGII